MAVKGNINSIETFGGADGPAIRYVVFLQGCPMRCKYCHNPETWEKQSNESYLATAQEVFDKAYRYRTYWKNGGGITVSGGEALLQMEFVTDLFRIAKSKGISTVLDTSGCLFNEEINWINKFDTLLSFTDFVLLDIKHIDERKHIYLTGHSNKNILNCGRYLAKKGIHMWIRHVLVPGYTDDIEDLKGLRRYIDELRKIDKESIERVEVLPYHDLAKAKYQKLSIPYPFESVDVPSKEQIIVAESILKEDNYSDF